MKKTFFLALFLLMANTALAQTETIDIENMFDYNVLVSFAEYESPSFDAVVESLAAAKEAGLIDLNTALHRLWDNEYSEEEIEIMKVNIENEIPDPMEEVIETN